MTCARVVGVTLLFFGVALLACCIEIALASPSTGLPVGFLQLMEKLRVGATFACVLAAAFIIAGGLTIMRSRYAFASCVAAVVATLMFYAFLLATLTTPDISDIVFLVPILLLCGIGAVCSRRRDHEVAVPQQ